MKLLVVFAVVYAGDVTLRAPSSGFLQNSRFCSVTYKKLVPFCGTSSFHIPPLTMFSNPPECLIVIHCKMCKAMNIAGLAAMPSQLQLHVSTLARFSAGSVFRAIIPFVC